MLSHIEGDSDYTERMSLVCKRLKQQDVSLSHHHMSFGNIHACQANGQYLGDNLPTTDK
jgi:hypothetical protein